MNNIGIYINGNEVIRFEGFMNLQKGATVYFLGERYRVSSIESKNHTVNVYLEHDLYNRATINFGDGVETATIKHGCMGKEKLNPFRDHISSETSNGIGIPSKRMGFGAI